MSDSDGRVCPLFYRPWAVVLAVVLVLAVAEQEKVGQVIFSRRRLRHL